MKLHDLLEEVPPKVANDTCFTDKDANSGAVAMQFEVKEVKQNKRSLRRLLEPVSCFAYNQRYEDKVNFCQVQCLISIHVFCNSHKKVELALFENLISQI